MPKQLPVCRDARMVGQARSYRAMGRTEIEQQIDKLVAAIRAALARSAPLDPVVATVMVADGIDGSSLARPQIAALAALSTEPTLTEGERNHAAAQLAALGMTI
ncbi:hypothetical protein [Janthinobacterium psychrotolerans]|uniref:hypothetical protein n=1 Tax=Janthinobacterium psychrotolerans TaxID=1747903 RepID=UPI0012374BD6|nr:hypothetical protein [Janthinobacterium psychrotolerans]